MEHPLAPRASPPHPPPFKPATPSAPAPLTCQVSIYDVLLLLLLHLCEAPAHLFDDAVQAEVRQATRQRLRELVWRDLEQGCTWAHLSSVARPTGSDDSHWARSRHHVTLLIAR